MKTKLFLILMFSSMISMAQGSGDLVFGIPDLSNCYQKVHSELVSGTGTDTVRYNFLDHPSGRLITFGTAETNPVDVAGWQVVFINDYDLNGEDFEHIVFQGDVPVSFTTEVEFSVDRIIATPINTQTQTNLASIEITFISPESAFNITPKDDDCFTYDLFRIEFETFLSGLCKNPMFILHQAGDTTWNQVPINPSGFPILIDYPFNGGPNFGTPLNPDSLCEPPVVSPPDPTQQPYPRCTQFTLEIILQPCDEFYADPRCPTLNIPYPLEICCMCDLEVQPANN